MTLPQVRSQSIVAADLVHFPRKVSRRRCRLARSHGRFRLKRLQPTGPAISTSPGQQTCMGEASKPKGCSTTAASDRVSPSSRGPQQPDTMQSWVLRVSPEAPALWSPPKTGLARQCHTTTISITMSMTSLYTTLEHLDRSSPVASSSVVDIGQRSEATAHLCGPIGPPTSDVIYRLGRPAIPVF